LSFSDITNPSSISTTDSFGISIYYVDGVNVIDQITLGATFTAKASPSVIMDLALNSLYTGINNEIKFTINTGSSPVLRGSYFTIQLPSLFRIFNYTLAAQTCVSISGFSDGLECSFSGENLLKVSNGFNS
jgi:hypothetical protein